MRQHPEDIKHMVKTELRNRRAYFQNTKKETASSNLKFLIAANISALVFSNRIYSPDTVYHQRLEANLLSYHFYPRFTLLRHHNFYILHAKKLAESDRHYTVYSLLSGTPCIFYPAGYRRYS